MSGGLGGGRRAGFGDLLWVGGREGGVSGCVE